MSSLTAERLCPSCGSSATSSTPEVRSRMPAEELPDDQLVELFVGLRPEQSFFTYFRCTCGLLWNPMYFSGEALKEIYSSMPQNTSVMGERESAKTQQGYASLIARSAPRGGVYLELGADVGLLAERIIQSLKPEFTLAVEPNIDVHGRLQQSIGPSGTVFQYLREVDLDRQINLVAAVHVLDHLLDPKDQLSAIRDKMGSGVAFFVVHNERSALRSVMRTRWAPFCLQHPQLFNPRTLNDVARSTGFVTSAITRTTNWLSLRQAGVLGASVTSFPMAAARKLPTTAIPIRLGNIALIARSVEAG